MELSKEKEFALKNFNRLLSALPKKLSEREDRFGEQIKKSKTSAGRNLKSLYSFIDEVYRIVVPYTPCKKGCSLCCNYEVSISEIEISHIEKHTKIKRAKVYSTKRVFHGTACPFLEGDSCSIYEARPFVCRRHVVLTKMNHWCDPVRSNEETFTLLKFTGIDDAYDHIRRESGSYESFDIRQVFLHAAPNKIPPPAPKIGTAEL